MTMARTAFAAAAIVLLAACSAAPDPAPYEPGSYDPGPRQTSPVAETTTQAPEPGTVPPDWLGTRPLPIAANGLGEIQPTPAELSQRRFTLKDSVPPLDGDGWAVRIDPAPPEVLARSSWTEACPVSASELSWIRLTFWGFDNQRHTGELLVNDDVADDLAAAFRAIYEAQFPIEEMRITRAEELEAEPTGDGNNTSAFTCKPSTGGGGWSEHAYGRAVDINPFQNPYIRGDILIPELATDYRDRERDVPGMIAPNGPVTSAFAEIGWGWGGAWRNSTDWMHFSRNGL